MRWLHLALASSTGVMALAPMLHGLREYRGEPHRVDSVALCCKDVECLTTAKAPTWAPLWQPFKSLGAERRLVVIFGGDGKGQDFAPLVEPAQAIMTGARWCLIGARCHQPLAERFCNTRTCPLHDAASWPEAVTLCTSSAHVRRRGAVVPRLRQPGHVSPTTHTAPRYLRAL
jgi:UDP-N-acetylmuramoylalanine--D-glutamate ligase